MAQPLHLEVFTQAVCLELSYIRVFGSGQKSTHCLQLYFAHSASFTSAT